MYSVFGDRKIAIVREISKLHEEIIRDNISNIIKLSSSLRGEMVIVVSGYVPLEDTNDYMKLISDLVEKGYSKRDAIKEIAEEYSVSKNKLYNMFKEE